MVNFITDNETRMDALKGKKVAVVGYGAQGRAQALCLRDSGVDVVVGVRETGESWKQATEDGMNVRSIPDACRVADIIHILLPDEVQKEVFERDIKDHICAGKALSFSHGFNIVFGRIVAPAGVDVIMVAPKGPGNEVRSEYLKDSGLFGLVAVEKDATGNARGIALTMAKALGFTRRGVIECTFAQETHGDLFGEQVVLCGGAMEIVKAAFETLVNAGYPPEIAYFECMHELKLIADLIHYRGFADMWEVVSNTAEYGGQTVGKKLITEETRETMKRTLERIQSGEFAQEFVTEYENGMPNLKRMREDAHRHPIEDVGREIRARMAKK